VPVSARRDVRPVRHRRRSRRLGGLRRRKAPRPIAKKEDFRRAAGGGGVVYQGGEWRLTEYATAAALAWRDYEWTGRFRLPGAHQPGLGLLVYSNVASGRSDDPEGDAVCDERDNCPAAPNADQSDVDGDGSGDARNCCTAAFERQELCLDEGFDPRNDLSDTVVQLIGNVNHPSGPGACGSPGFYRLGRDEVLVVEAPSLPGRSLYRIQLRVRAKHAGDTPQLKVADGTVLVPPDGRALPERLDVDGAGGGRAPRRLAPRDGAARGRRGRRRGGATDRRGLRGGARGDSIAAPTR
jgi:hypothetical protein